MIFVIVFLVAGLYTAVEEALEPLVTAKMVPADRLARGYDALRTVNGAIKFVSSSAVEILWSALSPIFAFGMAATAMASGAIALARLRRA